VDGHTLLTSGSVDLTSGIQTVQILGLDDLDVSGSSAGETVVGNSGANIISTGGGNDTVHAGQGNDQVTLGDGNDFVKAGGGAEDFDGGAGKDYISYYDSTGGITANLSTNTILGSWAEDDTINSFESIAGSSVGGDTITGTNGANVIKTFGGNDRVFAGKGADVVELGSGNDYVKVGGGRESFDGGSGRDYISYANSGIGVRIDLAADTISEGWGGNDIIKSFEGAAGSGVGDDHISGDDGTNTLRGLGGNDNLNGRGGDDRLFGGDGKDRLDGGQGSDDLFGGGGADKFHFDLGDGSDTVKDFQNNVDRIEIDNFSFAPGIDAFDFAGQVGNNVVFTFDSGDILTIEDTNIGALANDLFMV
jgi:serralysin